jgi:hypothetical protein
MFAADVFRNPFEEYPELEPEAYDDDGKTVEYAQNTVAQLKQIMIVRDMYDVGCKKKADYIAKIIEADKRDIQYKRADAAHHARLNERYRGMNQRTDEIKAQAAELNELHDKSDMMTAQTRSMIDVIMKLENKTPEQYEKIIGMYELLLKLSDANQKFNVADDFAEFVAL